MRLSLLNGFAVGMLALAAGVASAADYVPGSIAGNGSFQIVNGRFYDPAGKEFVAKGVNVQGQNYWWPRDITQDAGKIVDAWNFNMIRVGCDVLPDSYSWGNKDNNDLDKIIQTYTSRGVVVMFEAHDKTGSFYTGQDLGHLQDFYYSLASKYKNNPYVWFNVMNEPGDGMGDRDASGNFDPTRANQWVATHQAVIKTIRDVAGANNVIIADAMNYAQDVGEQWTPAAVTANESSILKYGGDLMNFGGKQYANVGFGLHTYGWWWPKVQSGQGLGQFVRAVRDKNYAMLIGEYGFGTPDDPSVPLEPIAQQVFDVSDEYGIGKLAWSWFGGDFGKLVSSTDPNTVYWVQDAGGNWVPRNANGGWMINSDTNPTNLTPMGQMIWADNHAVVPEPGVLVGLALAVPAVMARRRRHG